MSNNASTIDTQQVHASTGSTTAKVSSPQATLPPLTSVKDTPAIVDATVFAGTASMNPIQTGDGTSHLSFVPIGGTFVDATNTTPDPTKSASPDATDKDGEDNALSPLTLPLVPLTEKSTSPPPIPIPPRSQSSGQSRANSPHGSPISGDDTDRELSSREAMSTLWRRVKALNRYHAAHHR